MVGSSFHLGNAGKDRSPDSLPPSHFLRSRCAFTWLKTGAVLQGLEPHPQYLVYKDRSKLVLDLRDRQLAAALTENNCLRPDGVQVARAFENKLDEKPDPNSNAVHLYDALSNKEMLTLKGHTAPVLCIAYSLDGRRLASGSKDQTVKLWDVATGQEILTLKGHRDAVNHVVFSADGQCLATASRDGVVQVWDATPRR